MILWQQNESGDVITLNVCVQGASNTVCGMYSSLVPRPSEMLGMCLGTKLVVPLIHDCIGAIPPPPPVTHIEWEYHCLRVKWWCIDLFQIVDRNEVMLEESRNTVTVPSMFVFRILAYLHRRRRSEIIIILWCYNYNDNIYHNSATRPRSRGGVRLIQHVT